MLGVQFHYINALFLFSESCEECTLGKPCFLKPKGAACSRSMRRRITLKQSRLLCYYLYARLIIIVLFSCALLFLLQISNYLNCCPRSLVRKKETEFLWNIIYFDFLNHSKDVALSEI
eukprot:NODE_100_length_20777_cov_0.240884.p20 type:complete len:118 gc:universal NODE_100_length_20777_cov_0.240884:19183-18830(-)